MSGDREKILARIAEALTAPGRQPHSPSTPLAASGAVTAPFREWLPPVGDSFAERHALFSRQCAALKAELCDCSGAEDAAARIGAIATVGAWKRLAMHPGELTDAVAPFLPKSLEVVVIQSGYDKDVLEACGGGLTECECLVAQTGSVCVTNRSSGGRALSVLPPHHVVLARTSQLEPDLTAAYERLAVKYAAGYPSFISFISGPSRTGDIERILVLGAHGPKWLTILLLP